MQELLGRFLRSFRCWLWPLPGFLLCSELLPYLGGDGFGVHFVGGGSFFEDGRRLATRDSQQDARLHQQPGERPLISTAKERSERLKGSHQRLCPGEVHCPLSMCNAAAYAREGESNQCGSHDVRGMEKFSFGEGL